MNKKIKLKNWIRRNHRVINIGFAIIGLVLFYIGMSKTQSPQYVPVFLTEIGIALITNAILLAISLLYFKEDDDYEETKQLYFEKGLIGIYESKAGINDKINNHLLKKHIIKEYDIICCGGLSTLRKEEGSHLINYIMKYNMTIRILTANPSLEYLLQQKIDEERELSTVLTYKTVPIENTIRNAIFDLYEWINHIKETLPDSKKNNIKIKFYSSLPPLQYHRVGSHVFIGQSVVGKNSQGSPTFEYYDVDNSNSFFKQYIKYFESLWNDPNYAQETPYPRLNAQLLISDSLINSILKLSCADLCECLQEPNKNKIRAVLSVCGYPKPQNDGAERRFNTNITRGDEICNINDSNGKTVNGQKEGYQACDEKQVVGRSNKLKKALFQVTGESSRYSILAIPLINNDSKVVANLSFEFDDDFNTILEIEQVTCSDEEQIINISSSKSKEVKKRAQTWAKLLSLYLGIKEQ